MRMTCGAPGGCAAWRAFAAAMTSITMNGGASAPLRIFNAIGSVLPNDACGHNLRLVALLDSIHRHNAGTGNAGAFAPPLSVSLRQAGDDDPDSLPGMIADAQFAERCIADDAARPDRDHGGALRVGRG